MLDFDKDGMTTVSLLTKEEALIFGLFLYSEMIRHQMDIDMIVKKISNLNERFELDIEKDYKRRFV